MDRIDSMPGLDPSSWTPDPWRRKYPRCRDQEARTRQSSGARRWSSSVPGVAAFLRGGSWNEKPRNLRSAYRNRNTTGDRNDNNGSSSSPHAQQPEPAAVTAAPEAQWTPREGHDETPVAPPLSPCWRGRGGCRSGIVCRRSTGCVFFVVDLLRSAGLEHALDRQEAVQPVGGNCKSPTCGNRKLHTLQSVGGGPPFQAVGIANDHGAAHRCMDGRRGCC